MLLSLEEVLGRPGVNAVLQQASLDGYIDRYPPQTPDLQMPFDVISRLQAALETAYGPRAGKGIALRAGRACFKHGLREFGPELGLTGMDFRLLPLPEKMKASSTALVRLFNGFNHERVHVDWDKRWSSWHIGRCPFCFERSSDAPVCQPAVGFLQEALYWVSGGKIFHVEETECIACGADECTIVIDLNPMN